MQSLLSIQASTLWHSPWPLFYWDSSVRWPKRITHYPPNLWRSGLLVWVISALPCPVWDWHGIRLHSEVRGYYNDLFSWIRLVLSNNQVCNIHHHYYFVCIVVLPPCRLNDGVNCSLVSEVISWALKGQSFPDHVALFGNSLPQNPQDWVPIQSQTIALVNSLLIIFSMCGVENWCWSEREVFKLEEMLTWKLGWWSPWWCKADL